MDFKPTVGCGDRGTNAWPNKREPSKKGAWCKPDNIRITTWEMEEIDAKKAEDGRCTERDRVGGDDECK